MRFLSGTDDSAWNPSYWFAMQNVVRWWALSIIVFRADTVSTCSFRASAWDWEPKPYRGLQNKWENETSTHRTQRTHRAHAASRRLFALVCCWNSVGAIPMYTATNWDTTVWDGVMPRAAREYVSFLLVEAFLCHLDCSSRFLTLES